ncbi:unannotated protein [freshwater metagenome]|uniref:Unannotated protein n=1 Tax=freshwater metagenome TaxID=449393 RepID=A0A6J6Z9W7_9ZZZZ
MTSANKHNVASANFNTLRSGSSLKIGSHDHGAGLKPLVGTLQLHDVENDRTCRETVDLFDTKLARTTKCAHLAVRNTVVMLVVLIHMDKSVHV